MREELCHCNKTSTLCDISRTQLELHSEVLRLFFFTNILQNKLVPFFENTSVLNLPPPQKKKPKTERDRERKKHYFHTPPHTLSELKENLLTYSQAGIDKTAQERGGGQKDQGSALLKLIPHAPQLLAVFYFLLQRFVEKII